jgi:ligand-binding sensor domain-containing protein/signal transduction histidine kinase
MKWSSSLWAFPVLFLLLSGWNVCALNPAKSVFQYNCRSWARQNGLPANGVYAITQTTDGYIWLGTPRGLVRFDGEEFKLFDMNHIPLVRSTIVTSLSNSKDGGLWFGMERGSFGFCDGRNISLMGRDEWGGRSLLVQSVLETGNGDLWIAAERLAARLVKKEKFVSVLTDEGTDRYDVTSLCQDTRGRIWLGTAERGLYYWTNGVLTKFIDSNLDTLNIRSLAEDKMGQIWVGTERGLFCYDKDLKRQAFPYPWYQTRALLADREGAVWAGTSGGGLVRILNGTLTQFRKIDGLADDFVSALAEDKEGSLWVGTRNGLSQLSDVKIPTFGKTEGLTADVNVGVYASRKGGVWVGTGEGVTYFDGYAHPYASTNAGLRNAYVMQVYEAKNGDLYLINGSKDVEIFSGGKVVARYRNKSWPSAMTEDDQGVVVAVSGELYRVSPKAFKPYPFNKGVKPPLHWIYNMTTSRDGSIWLAGDEGICRVNDGKFTMWSKNEGLPNAKVLWVTEDSEGILWAGLETGLGRLKDGQIRVITQQDGLFDNIINVVVPDDCGSLWVDSSRGFFRVSRQSLNDFADWKSDHVRCAGFDGLDAIKSAEKYQQQPSGCKTADGRIWFPTSQGIVMIDPTNLIANPIAPNVHIHQVVANGVEVDQPNRTVVRPGEGNLEFHYAGLSYIAPLKIQYRYKLHGFDKNWVDAGTRRAAFYTNLKPGKYQFQVQACNEDGVWNDTGATFSVELQPHYYQTIWFYSALGVMMFGCLVYVYIWVMRRVREKQKALQSARDLLEAKVTERTSALASSNMSLVKEVKQRELEVQERKKAQSELERQKSALEKEIEERHRMQLEVERVHRQLLDASHRAGQAEVASSVLHNVGNVLNSVNVSTSLVKDRLRKMRLADLTKAMQLMNAHSEDLGRFLTSDEKGRHLPRFLGELIRHLGKEQEYLLNELKALAQNVEHINEIVAMQQSYAKVSGVMEKVVVSELVESALKMHIGAYRRHSIQVVRDYQEVAPIIIDKHKTLQILVNIFANAKYACDGGVLPDKRVIVRIRRTGADRVRVEIADNGIGIAPENLTRIFSHGFTTRKEGHGFGLHSAALAAKDMKGTLNVHSDGLGKGATFVLELPTQPPHSERIEEIQKPAVAV